MFCCQDNVDKAIKLTNRNTACRRVVHTILQNILHSLPSLHAPG